MGTTPTAVPVVSSYVTSHRARNEYHSYDDDPQDVVRDTDDGQAMAHYYE